MFYRTVPFRGLSLYKALPLDAHYMLEPHLPRLSLSPPRKLTSHFRAMSVFSAKRLENKTVLLTGASAGIGEVFELYVVSQLA
jgi:hypothetical protein